MYTACDDNTGLQNQSTDLSIHCIADFNNNVKFVTGLKTAHTLLCGEVLNQVSIQELVATAALSWHFRPKAFK